MSLPVRSAAAGLATLFVCVLLAAGAWQLQQLNNVLADPVPLIQQVVDEYLAGVPAATTLRADDPLLGRRTILVTANINERTASDVVSRLLYLNAQDSRRPIELYLSTQGGWVDSAFTIIDVIERIEAPVNTWAIGGCYSAGALILSAGTGRRYATPNAILMIHASLDPATTTSFAYEQLALERYERVWRERAALPAAWFPMVGGEEYYLSAQEALKFKLIDEIAAAPRGIGGERPATQEDTTP
jgi:ATP-dependent Clp protease protease subunit